MRTIQFLVILCLCQFAWSQNDGINYKAVIKDDLGNLIIDQTIAVQFTILKGAAQTNVYQEAHLATTDNNGIILLNIGKGSTTDDFSSIDWESSSHFLNVQVNIDEGFIDLGTTKFNIVPYAITAQRANNVTGLETLDEGNGAGWRLISENPDFHGDIGLSALDLSTNDSTSTTHGATGESSTALGFATAASGNYSTAMGNSTEASAIHATAGGRNTLASGYTSTAFGSGTTASGSYATAIGNQTTASGYASTALGNNTTASAHSSISLGAGTIASADYSTAMGRVTQAISIGATTLGEYTMASGDFSFAMGSRTKAESMFSTSMGQYNIGGGLASTWKATDPLFEIGNGLSNASRANALTVLKNGKLGIKEHQPEGFLEIKAPNSTTQPHIRLVHEGSSGARISFTNTEVSNGNKWTLYGDPNNDDENSVFNIFHPNKGNIIRVQGDGQVGINGVPDTDLHVYLETGMGPAGGGFKLETNGPNAYWWRLNVNNGLPDLKLYSKSQGTTSVGKFNDVTGAYSATSDRRLKKDFIAMPFSWENFADLKTYSYLYKAQKDNKRSLGLIAQELEPIYPELVNYDMEDDVYHLNYSGLGVVAIKAIQELKAEVDTLKKENGSLKEKLSKLDDLEARLSTIEARIESRLKLTNNDQ